MAREAAGGVLHNADRPGQLPPLGADQATGRVRVDGKFFRAGRERFRFTGVTYGTFRPRQDGARFPDRERMKTDLESMREHGISVVRTYTPPPGDLIDLAADYGLRVLAGVFFPDWRYLLAGGRRDHLRILAEARTEVRSQAGRLAGEATIFGVCIGNEIPADVVRWHGAERVARVLGELVDEVRNADPDLLVTYANYPTAEYLTVPGLDFLTYNVFLERKNDFRRYLTRLHHLAGDRPLVLGEVGLDAGSAPGAIGEARQAETIDWQLSTALERGVAGACIFSWTDEWHVGESDVEGWSFGLTRGDRSPRPALEVVQRWSRARPSDLQENWPSLSIVICAYNAESTLDECLIHTCALDYPGLEIIVVDDGSTDSTAAIAAEHSRVRLIRIPHGGLSVARNAGMAAARSELVAYLDADAYPSPEWPYYLVMGFDAPDVAATGGPNLPPYDDGLGAEMIARAPGGPVHVLYADDRAEHVPGCNMAFWKEILQETGGFDPVYTSAGDDVDMCWKVLDRGYGIGFHPAALVWHHRRPGIRTYLRQQRGYGRSEALVEQRHPDRFTRIGTARWRGRIYNPLVPSLTRPRIYRGLYGSAPFQSIYGGGGHALDIAHQVGIPVALLAILLSPLAAWNLWLGLPGALGVIWIIALGVVDVWRVEIPRRLRQPALSFRLGVGVCHIAQPVVRTWARTREQVLRGRSNYAPADLPIPRPLGRGVLLYPDTDGRPALVSKLVGALRGSGLRVLVPSGWEDHDARLLAGFLVAGDMVSSAHPEGCVQVRIRKRLRRRGAALGLALVAIGWAVGPVVGAVVLAVTMIEALRGFLTLAVRVPRALGTRS